MGGWLGAGIRQGERVLGGEARGLRSGPGFASVCPGASPIASLGLGFLPLKMRVLDLMISEVPIGR